MPLPSQFNAALKSIESAEDRLDKINASIDDLQADLQRLRDAKTSVKAERDALLLNLKAEAAKL